MPNEYFDSESVEELVDIVEVVLAILKTKGMSINEFDRIRTTKNIEKGGFDNQIFLDSLRRRIMWRVAVIGNRRGIEPDNMFICKFCGKICQNPNSLRNHERTCRSNPEWNPHAFKCQYCGREFPRKNYLTQHEPHCSHNPEYTPYPSWIRGLTKETDSRVKRQSESRKQIYETIGGTFKGRQHTSETKNKMRQIALENENESHFGRREWFTYKDKKFISSYEVKVAQELDEHGILWEQPQRLPYIDANGKTHHYIPDFYLPNVCERKPLTLVIG